MNAIKAGMTQSLTEGRAGTLLNESFAVAEKPVQESARFSLSGNLFENPNWAPQRPLPELTEATSLLLYISFHYRSPYSSHPRGPFFSTLCVSARSIATVITFSGFSSFTIVVTDVDGETAEEGGGISSFLPECARSSKLLNVDLSRFEDGDMLRVPVQPRF